jgi:hypothetical protein
VCVCFLYDFREGEREREVNQVGDTTCQVRGVCECVRARVEIERDMSGSGYSDCTTTEPASLAGFFSLSLSILFVPELKHGVGESQIPNTEENQDPLM